MRIAADSLHSTQNPSHNENMCAELGFYALAGGAMNPRDVIDEIRLAEELGIGAAFISERLAFKEACTISGAMAAASTSIGIGTAATNFNLRNPLVTAGHATTMQALSGGRYALGIGRGIDRVLAGMGLKTAKTAQLEDFAHLMRRLAAGERVAGHDGAAGSWPSLSLAPVPAYPIPLIMPAFGPQSLKFAARTLDGVVLHTFFTDETTRRCVDIVRSECERIGRDPREVRVWSCFATVTDDLGDEVIMKKIVGRLSSYLQGYGDLLISTNRWDPAPLERFRADPVVRSIQGAIDTLATSEQLEHIATLLPQEWMSSAAVGTPRECADLVNGQFGLGVDGVIMHGATPAELVPVVEAYRDVRFDLWHEGLPANPGGRRAG